MASLREFASRSGVAFESSPSGRWVKFEGGKAPIYVVEGAWGNNYLVWSGSEPEPEEIERYRRPEEAMKAALKRAS